jgi:anti-sigma factor RsiW
VVSGARTGRLPSPRIAVSSPAGSLPLAADCFISRLHLHDFVDGELDADVPGTALREIILAHLVHCPRCARLEQQLRGMLLRVRECGERLSQQADERASPQFRARMARLLAG